MLKYLLTLLMFTSVFASAEKHVQMTATVLEIDSKNYLAMTLKNDKGWHTYWKNPGDAGIPVKFKFSLGDNKVDFHELEWPTPKKYIEPGNILAFGYSDTYSFFFGLTDQDVKNLIGKKLHVKGTWLVCENICIPGQGELDIQFKEDIQTVRITGADFQAPKSLVRSQFATLPQFIDQPKNLEIS